MVSGFTHKEKQREGRRHVAKGSRMAVAKKLPISGNYGHLYAGTLGENDI